jgi:hypothetical protein
MGWGLLLKYWWILAIAALVTYLGFRVYDAGQEDIQKKWDASVARGIIEVQKLKEKQVVVTTRVETKYIDRIKTIREKGDVIVQKVPVYIPADTPDFPGGFRVLLDGAATGIVPDAGSELDAAPVPAQTLAASVADNYGTCLANAEQLTGLQEWVREQQALNP